MSDSKYFGTNKRGEIFELREELGNQKEEKRKEAVKKVIAAMTVGKDVSELFTDVLNCIQTNNLELKKLVYLYVINHAKMQPDRAILAVNTFQRDASDPNPLIRALAIRTMGCIRVDKVIEYLCEPLRKCLTDKDPYVRKTAAICVAKLYDMQPERVEEQGFLDTLHNLLSDSNPTVVANAVAALTEIDDLSGKNIFNISTSNLQKLQSALNECTEWGQVFILHALSKYRPKDSRDAESIIERVVPRLNHANSAVVLASVRIIMMFMEHIQNAETIKTLCRKMAPPLVTLLTTKEPEIQYVALRNINLIVQKRPSILQNELRVFFIKYNDPIYVKMEKLEILIMLASDKNIDQVLNEFKEAASEVDVEFVRKAVRAIGRCAIKISQASEQCIEVLLDLIKTKINYVVQEAIIVIKDIFRKYPNRYESVIATLCENLDTLDEPEAKASMIWIIGEYAERIENANELLDTFLEGFNDENPQVQLALLTATVKLFLKKPKDTQEMVQKVLNSATQETDNPDLRDRGYVYWRLLSTDPEAAKNVVLGKKPLISDNTIRMDESLLDDLISNISNLASIYHKPPESFVPRLREVKRERSNVSKKQEKEAPKSSSKASSIFDMEDVEKELPKTSSPKSLIDDFDFFGSPSVPTTTTIQKEIILPADKGQGMQISGAFVRKNGNTYFDLTFSNLSPAPQSSFAIQFNKNSFGLFPSQPQISSIPPGQSADQSLLMTLNPSLLNPSLPLSNIIQIAVKNNVGVYYFQANFPLHALFVEKASFPKADYLALWKSIDKEHFKDLPVSLSSSQIQQKLTAHNFAYVANREVQQEEFLYFSATLAKDNIHILLEIQVGPSGVRSCVKTSNPEFVPLFEQSLVNILTK